jgi:glycosidase
LAHRASSDSTTNRHKKKERRRRRIRSQTVKASTSCWAAAAAAGPCAGRDRAPTYYYIRSSALQREIYLELPNDVWNIPHRIPRSLVWLSTSRAQHNQIHFYTATSSDISQPIVSLQNKSSTKNRFSELSLI